jgi:hypothetical protein
MAGISKYPKANLEDYNLGNSQFSRSFGKQPIVVGQNDIEVSDEISNAVGDLRNIKRRKEQIVTRNRVNDYCDEDLVKVGTVPNLGNINNLSRFKADLDNFSQNVNVQSSLVQTKIKK